MPLAIVVSEAVIVVVVVSVVLACSCTIQNEECPSVKCRARVASVEFFRTQTPELLYNQIP